MKALRYESPRSAMVVDSDRPTASESTSVADTMFTSVSAGTEMGFYRGTAPQLDRSADTNGLFHPSPGAIAYPMQSDGPGVWWMGYSAVGRVCEVAPADTSGLVVGDLVWAGQGHKSLMVSDHFLKLPEDLDPEHATLLALIEIAFNGMLDAKVKLLDDVVIFGMGTLGLLLLQMCVRAGARVIAVDALPSRLDLARKFGATTVIDVKSEADAGARVQDLTAGRGADVVFEVTGNVEALPAATRSAGYEGIVTVLSFYQQGAASLQLGQEFHHKRLTLRSSQIGGIDPKWTHRYDTRRRLSQAVSLCQTLDLGPLISHRVAFADLPQALKMIDEDPSACQAVVVRYDQ